MAVAAALVLLASMDKSLPLFYVGFIALFAFSGLGNGSTYKMIPATFSAKAARAVAAGQDRDAAEQQARRLATAAIGVAAGIGAFGGVLVNVAFRQSFLATGTGNGAYYGFIAFYLAAMALTWAVYLRPGTGRVAGV
jgi:NNP family nitrate/nitrite transporter-like MFS transporter